MAAEAEAAPEYCRHFRQKMMYVRGFGPELGPVEPNSQGHCWCLITLQQVGPDEYMVHPEDCVSGRPCHEPY